MMTKGIVESRRSGGRVALTGMTLTLLVSCSSGGDIKHDDGGQADVFERTSFVRYLPGLDVEAEYITEFSHDSARKYVRLDGGEPMSPSTVRSLERGALRSRFGAMAPELAQELERTPPTEIVPVAIVVDTPIDWADVARIAGIQTGTLRADLELALLDARERLSSVAALEGSRLSTHMPVIYAETTAGSALALARAPGVLSVLSNRPGRAYLAAPPNGISFAGIDTGLNDEGFFGARMGPTGDIIREKIGFVEVAGCGMYGKHERFQTMNMPPPGGAPREIIYQVEPVSCNPSGFIEDECGICAGLFSVGTFFEQAVCTDAGLEFTSDKCVWRHASRAAGSAVAGRDGDPWGASDADIYYANEGVAPAGWETPLSTCYMEGIDHSYGWLAGEGVGVVSESFYCAEANEDGFTQDFYARVHGMFIVKGGGNSETLRPCEFTLNSLCVGGTLPDGSIHPQSSYLNPMGSDREEPDVSMLATGLQVHGFSDPADETVSGTSSAPATSFAAPLIAGMGVLLRQSCGSRALDPRFLRAIMRGGAHYLNPHGEDYNTPRPGVDHRDGAGVPREDRVRAVCGVEDEGSFSEADIGEFIFEDSGPLPGYLDSIPDTESDPPGDDGNPTTLGIGPGEDWGDRVGQRIYSWDGREPGDRLRATVVWDSCPLSSMGMAPSAVATDFDLLLYNASGGEYLYASQSFDDSVEGFDVRIPEGWGGDYELWMVHEPDGVGCDGNDFEPWAWMVTSWPRR